MADKLYGIWYQARYDKSLREEWAVESTHRIFNTTDIRIARAQCIRMRSLYESGSTNIVVCEIGDDGRPFNCDEELWEI